MFISYSDFVNINDVPYMFKRCKNIIYIPCIRVHVHKKALKNKIKEHVWLENCTPPAAPLDEITQRLPHLEACAAADQRHGSGDLFPKNKPRT